MTTTPTEWLGDFEVNTGNTTGSQSLPQIIGLSDGNFIVIWVDDTNNVDSNTGTDIIAQIYDPLGSPVGSAFTLNTNFFSDDEGDPIIQPFDGGFIMVYEDNTVGGATAIRWDKFDNDGSRTDQGTIASESAGADTVRDPGLAVFSDGSFVATFERIDTDGTGQEDIRGVFVSSIGAEGAEFAAATNATGDFNRDPASAALTNGNFVTVYEEEDTSSAGIEARVQQTNGTNVSTVNVATDTGASDPAVSALTGGGFVVVWVEGGDIKMQVRDNANSVVLATTDVATVGVVNEPTAVGLSDGGYVVFWDDDTNGDITGQRYDAAGTAVGSNFDVISGVTLATGLEANLTGDGRILITWYDGPEIRSAIWDPRDDVINGTSDDDVITSRIDGATINAGAGVDTVFGLGGDDIIDPGLAFGQEIDGGGGTDTLDFSDYFFGISVTIDLDSGVVFNTATGQGGGFSTVTDFENYLGSSGIDLVIGTSGANNINGRLGNDTIEGGLGSDTLLGGSGNDIINGGGQNDFISGGQGNDVISAQAGDDTASGNDGNDKITGGSGEDELHGNIGDDIVTGGDGDDILFGELGLDILSGGDGDDVMAGGSGNDQFFGAGGQDIISGGGQNDIINGGLSHDTLVGNSGFDTLFGGSGNDTLFGNANEDTLSGGGNNDVLDGGGDDDTLIGNAGFDTLIGGAGSDVLSGGTGDDKFDFNNLAEIANDTITDLAAGDFIDLADIEAANAINLDFIGTSGFSGVAGQVRYVAAGGTTTIFIDVDGDGGGDASIEISNGEFVLQETFTDSLFIEIG